jgi:hypothetical protein
LVECGKSSVLLYQKASLGNRGKIGSMQDLTLFTV